MDTEPERAIAAAKLANLKNGSNRYQKVGPSMEGPIKPLISQKEAAERLGTSTTSIQRARIIIDKQVTICAMAGAAIGICQAELVSK